jgi:hypothetical protein
LLWKKRHVAFEPSDDDRYAPDTGLPEDMLGQADMALYRAKEEGRDQFLKQTRPDIDVKPRISEKMRQMSP